MDGGHDTVLLALIGVVAASVTSMGFIVRAMLQPLIKRTERIENHVNGVEDSESSIRQEIVKGFFENDAVHVQLIKQMAEHLEWSKTLESRVKTIEDDRMNND